MSNIYITIKYVTAVLVFSLIESHTLFAHATNYALEKAPAGKVVWFYMQLGITHIIPFGLDHILFVVGLCLLSTRLKTIVWQATAFTVAHSITLALSMKDIIALPAEIVEPVIALSILFIAVENMLLTELKPWRVILVFFFGLIHGLGFAGVLNETGLPRNRFFTSVLTFNTGVELGQIAVILVVYATLILPFGEKSWYTQRVVYPLSTVIGLIATFWTVERIFRV